jgi:ABC-type glycerol-3-phosphate transport system substrate-binding protein
MCLGLGGCGSKTETETGTGTGTTSENTTLAEELGYGYLSTYSDLPVELEYVQQMFTAQGKLYLYGYYYDENNYDNSGYRLYSVDLETMESTQVPMPELVSTDNSGENIQGGLTVGTDGESYWMVTDTYTWSDYDDDWTTDGTDIEEEAAAAEGDDAVLTDIEALTEAAQDPTVGDTATENAATEEDAVAEEIEVIQDSDTEMGDYEAAAEDGDVYRLKKCDMEGNVLVNVDITEAVSEMSWFYCQNICQDAQGNILINTGDSIFCFGEDGTRKDDVELNAGYIQSMASAADGTVMVSYYNQDSSEMEVCSIDNGTLSQPLSLDQVNQDYGLTLYPGDNGKMLLSNYKELYELDTTSGTTTTLLSWLDSDINGYRINSLVARGDDTVLVVIENYSRTGSGNSYELGTLKKTPASELPQRTVLTMGVVYTGDELQDAIIDFNRKNDTYRINIVDYSSYNTDDDYTLGETQLERDVVSGNCPDLVSLDSGNVAKYISKGVLADLSEKIEADSDISMDQLLAGPLQAYTKDGKLYGMPYSFGIGTLLASTKLVGDQDSWTLEEMKAAIDGLDEDTTIMNYTTQADFLTTMVRWNMDRFVDYSNATCNFETEDFQSILEMASKLPADYGTEEDDTYTYVEEDVQLQTGDLLLEQYWASGSWSVKSLLKLYTKEHGITNIGYPTDSGNGMILNIYGGVAISSQSSYQDGAWEFVKSLLSDSFQTNQWEFPVTVSAFDKLMEDAMEPDYYIDENGETVYVDSTAWIGETEYSLGELTQEDVDSFQEQINGASPTANYDSDIMEILTDEAGAYFSGDKSAEEVAKLIQNRVSIYLGETS